jgi:hypothetical protein
MQIRDAREYFEALKARDREPRLRNVVGTWQIDVDKVGTWSIEVDRGVLRVTEGSSSAPKARLRFEEPAFVRLANGEGHENLITALLRNAIAGFEGDVAFAQKLQALLPLPEESPSPKQAAETRSTP